MKPIMKYSIHLALLAALFIVISASAQSNMFLEITGIAGDATSTNHPNTIVATGFSFANTNGTCAGFTDFYVTKYVDKASPLLMLNCAAGTSSPTVRFYLQNSFSKDYYKVT